ncbi:TetR family transcriptional regulator [Mycobacterium hodleri]|uniref:TetR family transcriptional regulator n=2 Tax=Mycolicibacterium hodleri TaxID=49897 RepID=A0A502EJN1_9MYCO|nr:TetR family transcriptional regulator [Mycolicibacterium hodleri]
MPTPPIGRRERKRRETRQTLVAAALSLFDTRGYDDVTVVDIAESADLDASTFFRHFGSKEAVLFTDMADFADGIGSALDVRPADEPLLEAIPCAMVELGSRRLLDVELEFLRGKLTESSSALRSLSSVYRERMVDALANAIARRLGTDPTTDPAPYLAATVWAASLDFYRRRIVATATSAELAGTASAELLGDVLDIVRPIWPHLGLAE